MHLLKTTPSTISMTSPNLFLHNWGHRVCRVWLQPGHGAAVCFESHWSRTFWISLSSSSLIIVSQIRDVLRGRHGSQVERSFKRHVGKMGGPGFSPDAGAGGVGKGRYAAVTGQLSDVCHAGELVRINQMLGGKYLTHPLTGAARAKIRFSSGSPLINSCIRFSMAVSLFRRLSRTALLSFASSLPARLSTCTSSRTETL